MSDRNIDELMDELYHLVDKAWRLPMSGGRTVVDGGEVRTILDELRENLPQETRQARAIVAASCSNHCGCQARSGRNCMLCRRASQ